MAQQVEYPTIPNTAPSEYQSVIKSLLGYIKREKPVDKDLRRHMRSRSIFDKETAPLLFDLLGISVEKGKPATLTELGEKLFDIDSDVEWKKHLFRHIAERNEILMKYVFDALFERLYSVNEMYRVLTSYVYPGNTITLVNFKNWMAWVEATGMIKYIGIRWGPSPLAKEIEGYLQSIDIEEILEEEGIDYEYDEEDFEGDEAEASVEAEGAPEEGEEELPDMPPEPPAAAQAPRVAAAAAAAAPAATVAPAATAAMPTYRTGLVLRSVAEIQEVQKVLELDPAGGELAQRAASLDDAEIAKNLEGLRDLWATAQDKTPLGFEHFGIDPDEYKKRSRKKGIKPWFLYRALAAATCAFRPTRAGGSSTSPAQDGIDRFKALEESGALTRHFVEGQPLDDVVTALVAAGYGDRLDVLSLTPYLVLARQALEGADDWIKEQEKADKEKFWQAAYERLHAGVFSVEIVWLVREMVRHGLWTNEGLAETGVVPDQPVLDIAFRIGLLPTPYLGDFNSTLFTSRVLTGFCGADHGFEAGLRYFGRQMGCAYDCPNRTTCTYFCREKLRR